MRTIHIIILCFFITACSPLETLPAPPTPQVITIQITPTLRSLKDLIQDCARTHPDIAVILEERSATTPEYGADTITIMLDSPQERIPEFAFPMGNEQIVFIAGSNFPHANLTAERLHQLYTSEASDYQVWGYPPGNELSQIFEQTILSNSEAGPHVQIAPEPGAMLSAIEDDPDAIGYIPKSWVKDSELILPMTSELEEILLRPILAMSQLSPEGALRTLLICLQQTER